MPEFVIEGRSVTCAKVDHGRRIWHCDCAGYQRRLAEYGEGFCKHVVLAIECAIRQDQITLPAD